MRTILSKLIRDFRYAKSKLLLLILATALSSWGISSVVYSYFMTERDFEENFEKTLPADMALVIDGYSDDLEGKILADANVVDLERREVVFARIRDSQGSWVPIIIYGIEDIANTRYDLISVLDKNNDVPGKFLIEKNAFFFLNDFQKEVELIFPDSTETVRWQLNGKVHDARQAPARMEGVVYAYTTSIDPLSPYLKETKRRVLIETNVSDSKEELLLISERLRELVEANGGKVVSVTIPNPGEHIHQGIVDGIEFLQKSGGSILAIMGIILLSLILLTWVFPQLTDIGVMKAIGASKGNIFASYSMALLYIIIVGIVLGLPAGYQTAALYASAVAFFQNFEVVERLLPFPIHLMVILICLTIPMLFSLRPLLKSANVSVQEAMNKVFYVPQKGIFKLSQRLILNPRLLYGLNNLFRQSQRTFFMLLLLGVGLALFFSASSVDYSIREDLKGFAKTSPYEIVVQLPKEMRSGETEFLNDLSFIEETIPVHAQRVIYLPPGHTVQERTLLRTMPENTEIPQAMILRGNIEPDCTECIYISGEGMNQEFKDVRLGSTVELMNTNGETKTYSLAGVLKDFVVIGAPFMTFNSEVQSAYNGVGVKLKSGLSRREFINASNNIDDAFIDNGINVSGFSSVSRRIAGIIGHLDPTFLILKITGVITIVIGLFGLIIVLNLTIQERTREIGVMKSLGSSFSTISSMFNTEFALVNLCAVFVGILLSIPVAKGLINVIVETIIQHPVAFKGDIGVIAITSLVVLVVQVALIGLYNKLKIAKNVRELLDHNF